MVTRTRARASARRPDRGATYGHEDPVEEPWYKQSRNILLAVIFLAPVGAVLAWLFSGWPTSAKVAATAWAVLLLGTLFAFIISLYPSTFATLR